MSGSLESWILRTKSVCKKWRRKRWFTGPFASFRYGMWNFLSLFLLHSFLYPQRACRSKVRPTVKLLWCVPKYSLDHSFLHLCICLRIPQELLFTGRLGVLYESISVLEFTTSHRRSETFIVPMSSLYKIKQIKGNWPVYAREKLTEGNVSL